MKLKALLLAFAIALAAPFAHAQYSVGPYTCGAASTTPLSCHGIPVSLGTVPVGSAWLNDQLSVTSTSPSFIVWEGAMSGWPQAAIGKSVCVTYQKYTAVNQAPVNQCVFLVVYFSGGDLADGSYYTGEATFHFDYYYGGYGRSAGWYRNLEVPKGAGAAGAIKLTTY